MNRATDSTPVRSITAGHHQGAGRKNEWLAEWTHAGHLHTRSVFHTGSDLESGTELDITLTLPAEITRGTEVFVRAPGTREIRVDRDRNDGTKHVGVAAVIERYDIIRGETSDNN